MELIDTSVTGRSESRICRILIEEKNPLICWNAIIATRLYLYYSDRENSCALCSEGFFLIGSDSSICFDPSSSLAIYTVDNSILKYQ